MAKRLGARLHLMTCLDIPEGWEQMSPQQRDMQPAAQQLINNTMMRFADLQLAFPDLDVSTNYCSGKLVDSVNRYAEAHDIDFIIMGSHGASGKNEFFIGSNTQKTVREVHRPVLVIKEPMETVNFDKVVFASSFHENEREAFLRFKEFVKPFVPEIHLVEVHTSSLFDPPYILSREAMEEFRGLCAPFRCETHIFRNFSVDQGIRTFAEKIGAKLIGISNHHRHPLRRMLTGSNVEALVNHSEIPVLSIDYPIDAAIAADQVQSDVLTAG
jgi:nucleotide-binding universal stress UspA family protein